MKIAATILWIVLMAWAVLGIRAGILSFYDYDNRFRSLWELADKASTIEQKQAYIDKFVTAIEESRREFADHNAVWLTTPDNSFEQNLLAVKSLQLRLSEIKDMDVRSFGELYR